MYDHVMNCLCQRFDHVNGFVRTRGEVLCVILEFVFKLLDRKELTVDSPTYPIVALEKYEYPSKVVGIWTNDVMKPAFGVILRAEFVRSNMSSGDKGNPTRDIYFKVLPMGTGTGGCDYRARIPFLLQQ